MARTGKFSSALVENIIAIAHLIEGPVGAGKSTFAAKQALTHSAPHLNLDEWMVTLFAPDRPQEDFMPWYAARKSRCIQQIWDVACAILDSGSDVILELGLVQLADREDFYRRVDGTDYDVRIYLLDTPLAVRRQRVRQRNEQQGDTYKMAVSDEIFELANSFWQAPSEQECRERDIEIVAS